MFCKMNYPSIYVFSNEVVAVNIATNNAYFDVYLNIPATYSKELR